MKRIRWLCIAFALAAPLAQARVVEQQMDVPVTVKDAYGKEVSQTIKLTVWSDDTNPTPAPVLVINHGRAAEAQERATFGRSRYGDASRFFVARGFIVALPTRVGYGVSGGDDVEDSGPCSRKNYPPGYAAAAQETLAILDVVRRRPDAAKDRTVLLGQSYGGATTVALAAMNPPGVQLAINFAGGGGGNPKTQPQQPCGQPQLEKLFADYGRTARVPMLWVYTENDMYFGPTLPREWHKAFTAAGGAAQFQQFPPHGEDGHSLFTRGPEVWQPRVAAFLDSHGFPAKPKP